MNQELIDMVVFGLPGTVLHAVEHDGTVAVVEQRGDTRWYHAREFTTDEDGEHEAGGYSTSDKHWYMGQRYKFRPLWGAYFAEVFWVDGESSKADRV